MLRRRAIICNLTAACLVSMSAGCFSPAGQAADTDTGEPEAALCAMTEDAETLEDQALQLVNIERTVSEEGLAPVTLDPTLSKIAADYACLMIEDGFFGHEDPITGHGPGERAVAGKYSYYSVGENLARGPTTAAEVVQLWMESPAHRAIILDPKWTEVGIAVRIDCDEGFYWVQEFGDPAPY
ncbi:MAG: CAP domain-containing protein [Phycisphaerales bacterium]|nr:MAG: CAP domain-containing protein [Phycisphaerales bacterium]